MTVRIRRAVIDDAPVLARMRAEFRLTDAGLVSPPSPSFLAGLESWLRDRLAGPAWLAWVAVEADGSIVGHVFLQVIEKIPKPLPGPSSIGYLTNFYVVPTWRGRGIGGALLNALRDHARAAGFYFVIESASTESVPLYRRHGYAPPTDLLELPIAAD